LKFAKRSKKLQNAKGKRDRITIFPEKIKTGLQNLIAGKNLNDYLFIH